MAPGVSFVPGSGHDWPIPDQTEEQLHKVGFGPRSVLVREGHGLCFLRHLQFRSSEFHPFVLRSIFLLAGSRDCCLSDDGDFR